MLKLARSISESQAEHILLEKYNIEGKATRLAGYFDQNFKISINNVPSYILKVSQPHADEAEIEFHLDLLKYLKSVSSELDFPEIVSDKNGNMMPGLTDDEGDEIHIRLLKWIPGRLWSEVHPKLDNLRFSLGLCCGKMTRILENFEHPTAHRGNDWDISQSIWTKDHLNLFNSDLKDAISYFQNRFQKHFNRFNNLRKSVIHHDANDNNILVTEDLIHPKVKALIDFGDAIHTQIINDVAIVCSYAIMNLNDPLDAALPIIKGYHEAFTLMEEELKYIYDCIGMRLVISITKSVINKNENPDNIYLQISEKPAINLIKKWYQISPDLAHYAFRSACGYSAHPNENRFKEWANASTMSVTDLFPTTTQKEFLNLDLSVSSSWLGHETEYNDLDLFQFKIDRLQAKNEEKILAGGYLEPRSVYSSSAYDKIGNSGKESRTIHLGIDFWLPAGTPVNALFDGEVITAVNDAGDKEYGGLVIVKHSEHDIEFHTLHGHLTVASALQHKPGDHIKKGDQIGLLGDYPENGNWAPHLHFQILMSMLDYEIDFPGVCYANQIAIWKSLCPDPNHFFKNDALKPRDYQSKKELVAYRKEHLGKSLSLQYKDPLKIVRGSGQYLIDHDGRKYLDTVNNVAHVGHEHYEVVKAGQEQMALLNTNTRYLHDSINTLTKALLETFPEELSVVHFVNSGSEANELALRMAKITTGEKDIIASEVGYHGNTNGCIEISSYKFDGKGGKGAPEHTQIFPLPDQFRGNYQGDGVADNYVKEIEHCIERIHKKGRGIAAFIVESIISCGGQIELPETFLSKSYDRIRAASGLCIADEVQTGCGRMGETFWGFQLHDVVPDIVTIGKPLGNGHPIAAVVCTKEVADAFANGMEYFNTFGGNPVSCAIASEVLQVVKQEKLQENALLIGNYLKTSLKELADEFPIIGDVRGQGLFIGIELVNAKKEPLPLQTDYLVNRMKDHGILMSSDGPDHNVLKIKPPMVFTKENANDLLFYLRKIFSEDFMSTNF